MQKNITFLHLLSQFANGSPHLPGLVGNLTLFFSCDPSLSLSTHIPSSMPICHKPQGYGLQQNCERAPFLHCPPLIFTVIPDMLIHKALLPLVGYQTCSSPLPFLHRQDQLRAIILPVEIFQIMGHYLRKGS